MAASAATAAASSVVRVARPAVMDKLVGVMDAIAPRQLAGSWDNVGELVSPSGAKTYKSPATIFVTNDLTEKVVAEAIGKDADIIVTYHPTPFRKSNRLHFASHTSRIVLACAARGIAVYSPHTGLDCAVGGINDWLASACGEGTIGPITPSEKVEGAGEGRIITLSSASTLAEVVGRVKAHLSLSNVRVAPRMDAVWESRTGDAEATMAMAAGISVTTAAVCAGSGGSVFTAGAARRCDVWLTGELSHHEVLAATQAGISVILTDHSNTERGYLPTLAARIEEAMGGDAACIVTELDADPLTVV